MYKKGMSAALTLVITIVVLIVVALALITITTENVATTGGNTENQQTDSFCNICIKNKCGALKSGDIVVKDDCSTGCPATDYMCP